MKKLKLIVAIATLISLSAVLAGCSEVSHNRTDSTRTGESSTPSGQPRAMDYDGRNR